MKKIIIISSILCLSGLLLLSYNVFLTKTQEIVEEISLEEFFNDYNENIKYEIDNKEEKQIDKSKFVAVIEIPNISLRTGIINSSSNYKSMNRNVSIFPNSNMPNEENGNFILFAHRGNSRVAYFYDIYKLNNGSYIYIYYNNVKYTYKVINKYDVNMYDHTPLNKIKDKTIITLITCKKGNRDYRTIIVGELIK